MSPRKAVNEERRVVDELDRIAAQLNLMVDELKSLVASEQERLVRLYEEGDGG